MWTGAGARRPRAPRRAPAGAGLTTQRFAAGLRRAVVLRAVDFRAVARRAVVLRAAVDLRAGVRLAPPPVRLRMSFAASSRSFWSALPSLLLSRWSALSPFWMSR